MKQRLLIVDDEPGIVVMMASYFSSQYEVLTAYCGNEALQKLARQPDLILLDINMPDIDGLTLCQKIRELITCPILFLTARVESADKIIGFQAGADDYIIKPFDLDELGARVAAHLRREQRHRNKATIRFFGELTIDYSARTVTVAGEPVALSKREFDIVELLSLNAGQVFAVRLARFIGCTQKRNIDGDIAQLVAPALASIREIITQAHDNGTGMPLSVVREKIQARMSDHAGFICHADKVRRATRDALLLNEFVQRHGLAIKHVGEVAELFMWRHMALTSAAVLTQLTQLTHYIDAGGGSRGARIILDRDGNSIPQTRNGFCDAWRFRSERTEDKKDKLLIHYCNGIFHVRETPVREFPIIRGIWFEKNWPGFLNGTIYQPQDEWYCKG